MQLTDPQLLAGMARLHENADFKRFMDVYIGGLLTDATQSCIESDQPARHQGAAQVLQRIREDLESAETAFYRVTHKDEVPLS